MKVTLSGINLYPVKSLAGSPLQSAHLRFSGLDHDREWMLIKPDSSFITQRSHPQMALVSATMEGTQLVLSSFGMESCKVPRSHADMPRVESRVFDDAVRALDTGDETARWLSQAIGDACRLVVFSNDYIRQCDQTVARPGDHTKFADAFPLLIISEGSLQDLNQRLPVAVTMDRFRPNLVVSGCDPFAEDHWKSIRINELPLRIVANCARCSVPTVDPETGILSGPEPIHTLSSYRQRDGEIYFGVNAVPDREGEIKVGDEIVVA